MPTPVYIICSKGGAVDKDTSAIHCLNVLETISVQPLKEGEKPPPPLSDRAVRFQVLAAWQMSIPDDLGKLFEAEVAIRIFDRGTIASEVVLAKVDEIVIISHIQRVLVRDIVFLTMPGPGTMLVECRLRLKGDTEWAWKQTYPLLLLEGGKPPEGTPPSGDAAPNSPAP
jgi:hypothetical protein